MADEDQSRIDYSEYPWRKGVPALAEIRVSEGDYVIVKTASGTQRYAVQVSSTGQIRFDNLNK